MKSIIKSFVLLCVFAATLISCETYQDPEVEYSPIYPLSGEWRVRITNVNTNALVSSSMYTFGTYNTTDNSTTQMWIRTTSNVPTFHPTSTLRTLKSKISCDVAGLSFSTTSIVQNLGVTTNAVIDTITITEGKITLGDVTMPSKVKSDRIRFKLTKTKSPGVTYLVEGYRRTRWQEDESFITFQ
jgi:hypothetical protein